MPFLQPSSVTVPAFPNPVGVTQSTTPWAVSGTVGVSNFPAGFSVTQGTSPWVVDGSGVTQPVSIAGAVAVSAASLPLPAGAATDATLEQVRDDTGELGWFALLHRKEHPAWLR